MPVGSELASGQSAHCCSTACVCATLARERTMGLSMMPRRKSRSMSLAPVEVGNSPRLSNTCCMAGWMERETETERERDKNS